MTENTDENCYARASCAGVEMSAAAIDSGKAAAFLDAFGEHFAA